MAWALRGREVAADAGSRAPRLGDRGLRVVAKWRPRTRHRRPAERARKLRAAQRAVGTHVARRAGAAAGTAALAGARAAIRQWPKGQAADS